MKSLFKAIIAAVLCLSLASCAEQPASLTLLSSPSIALRVGDISQILYTIEPATATVTWTSTDPSVADVAGVYVVAHSAGTAVLTGKAKGGASITINVLVKAPAIESFNMDAALSLYWGETGEVPLTDFLPEQADGRSLTFRSSDESVATVRGGKNELYVTAVAIGTADIVAEAVEPLEDGSKTSRVCKVTVKGPDTFSIEDGKTQRSIYVGGKDTLRVIQQPELYKDYTWENSNPEAVALTSKGNEAYLVALKEGSTDISVKAGDSALSIKVVSKGPDMFRIIGTSTFYQGQSMEFSALQTPVVYGGYKWSTDTPSVLELMQTEGEKITVVGKGVGNGKLYLEAGPMKSEFSVTVKAPEITIDEYPTKRLIVDETASVHATAQPTGNSESFEWTSSNANILTVTKGTNGYATVKAGRRSGVATVTVKLGSMTKSCQVEVIGTDYTPYIGAFKSAPTSSSKAMAVYENGGECHYLPSYMSQYNSRTSGDDYAIYGGATHSDYFIICNADGSPMPEELTSKVKWTTSDVSLSHFETNTVGPRWFRIQYLNAVQRIQVKGECPGGVTVYMNIALRPDYLVMERFSPLYSKYTTDVANRYDFYCDAAVSKSVGQSSVVATGKMSGEGYSLGAVPTAAVSGTPVYYRFVGYCQQPDGTTARGVVMNYLECTSTLQTGISFKKGWNYWIYGISETNISATCGSMPVMTVGKFTQSTGNLNLYFTVGSGSYKPQYQFYVYFTSKTTY